MPLRKAWFKHGSSLLHGCSSNFFSLAVLMPSSESKLSQLTDSFGILAQSKCGVFILRADVFSFTVTVSLSHDSPGVIKSNLYNGSCLHRTIKQLWWLWLFCSSLDPSLFCSSVWLSTTREIRSLPTNVVCWDGCLAGEHTITVRYCRRGNACSVLQRCIVLYHGVVVCPHCWPKIEGNRPFLCDTWNLGRILLPLKLCFAHRHRKIPGLRVVESNWREIMEEGSKGIERKEDHGGRKQMYRRTAGRNQSDCSWLNCHKELLDKSRQLPSLSVHRGISELGWRRDRYGNKLGNTDRVVVSESAVWQPPDSKTGPDKKQEPDIQIEPQKMKIRNAADILKLKYWDRAYRAETAHKASINKFVCTRQALSALASGQDRLSKLAVLEHRDDMFCGFWQTFFTAMMFVGAEVGS